MSYRLRVNHLVDRLPVGSYEEAAYVGLQDSGPRDALLGLHARVFGCEASDWRDPSLIQTYSPRAAVYVLPRKDFGVFTVGRLPLAPDAARRIDGFAEGVCRALDGRELRGGSLPGLRAACASGRIAVRWTTSALWVREVPRPAVDPDEARKELCRRHVHRFAPTSPRTYAWWAGLSTADAQQVWNSLSAELLEVDFEGTPAWIMQADEAQFGNVRPPRGTRFLVAPDLRLLGQDRDGLFIAPGQRPPTPVLDSFHPHGILVDGRIVGAWGRKSGRVDIRLSERLTSSQCDTLAAEVSKFPIRFARMSSSRA